MTMDSDPDFLAECGIELDPVWLIELNDYTPEQQQYVESLLRINMLLGAGLQLILKRERQD